MDYVAYNSGNYDKYQSKNRLKRKMVTQFDNKLIDILKNAVEKYGTGSEKMTIADLGCGEGFVTSLIANSIPEIKVIGIDGSQKAVDIAKAMNDKIDYKLGNIYGLDCSDGAYDIAVCSEVLEHLDEPEKALTEIRRAAKKAMLITVPHEPWFRIGNLLAFHNVSRLGNPIDHINHWSHGKFQEFIKEVLGDCNITFDKSFPWSIAYIELQSDK